MAKQKRVMSEAFKRWTMYIFLQNADKNKYGSILKGMIQQYSLDNNQFPKSMTKAMDVLANHPFDKKPNKGNGKSN